MLFIVCRRNLSDWCMTMLKVLSTRKLAWIGLATLTTAPFTARLTAQNTAATQSYSIQQTTRRILVDVVVTDRDGKPVRGLKEDDFTIQEDGKSQQIRSFEVEGSEAAAITLPAPPKLPANTFVDVATEPEGGPLYILVYDMVNTEPNDQATSFKPLLDFVDHIPPGTRLALYVNSDGLHLLQDFTSDRERLHAALISQGPGPHIPKRFMIGENYGKGDPHFTIHQFKFLARSYQDAPGRKNLIWLSGNLPAAISADPNHDNPSSFDDVKETLAAMARSQMALYPVDVKGVGFDTERPVGGSGEYGETAATGAGASSTVMLQVNSDAMGAFTGGRAYRGDNNIADLLRQAMNHGRNYYTLSYSPGNGKYNYAARRISVSLAQTGYRLSYRQLYYALPGDEGMANPVSNSADGKSTEARDADSLVTSVAHGGQMRRELLFRARLRAEAAKPATPEQIAGIEDRKDYFRTRRRMPNALPVTKTSMQIFHIEYAVLDAQIKATAEQSGLPANLEFAAVAYDASGRILNGMIDYGQSPASLKDGPKGEEWFHTDQQFDVPAGAAWIRLAVRDTSNDRTGTLEIPLPLVKEPDLRAAQP
jgi:VWFA-related protein